MRTPKISIINDKNLRGVVGSASSISQKMLEDIVELVAYSSKKIISRINSEFKKSGNLVSGRELRESLGV